MIELQILNFILTGWKVWAFGLVIYAVQALAWISFGALLAHEMCRP